MSEDREDRMRRMLAETAEDPAERVEEREAELYRLIFEALEEEPYPPLQTDLTIAVDARLDRMLSAKLSILEWAAVILLLAGGLVLVPGTAAPLGALLRFAAVHWESAQVDLLVVSSIAAALLGLLDRRSRGRRSLNLRAR